MRKRYALLVIITLLVAACSPEGIPLSLPGEERQEVMVADASIDQLQQGEEQAFSEDLNPASLLGQSQGDESQLSAGDSAVGCYDKDCHPEMRSLPGEFVHPPFADGACITCHNISPSHPEGSGPHVATMHDIEVCAECHPPTALGTSHPVDSDITDPFAGGLLTCTSTCHNPHIALYEYLLRFAPGGELCSKCHQEFYTP